MHNRQVEKRKKLIKVRWKNSLQYAEYKREEPSKVQTEEITKKEQDNQETRTTSTRRKKRKIKEE